METPLAPLVRRRLRVRATCLAAAALCLLAALAGAVVRADDLGHHHRHALVATIAAADNQGSGTRSVLDLAAPGRTDTDAVRPAADATTTAAAAPVADGVRTVRTRGPPAIAG
jgi:hypothetical protein